MKKDYLAMIKKPLSLVMACFMLLSCWVFVAPEKAEAADATTYWVTIYFTKSNSPSGHIEYEYIPINSDGSYNKESKTGKEVFSSIGGASSPYSFEVPAGYWPWSFNLHDSGSGSKYNGSSSITKILIGPASGQGVDIMGGKTLNSSKGSDQWIDADGGSTGVTSWSYPTVNAANSYVNPSSSTIKVPNSGADSSASSFNVVWKDQYNVVLPGNASSTSITSSCATVTASGNSASVKANHTVFDKLTSSMSSTGTKSATLSFVRGSITETATVTFQSDDYVATYNKADGTTKTETTYYKQTPPAPTTYNSAQKVTDTQHSTGTTWSPSSASALTGNVTFTETYNMTNHVYTSEKIEDATCTENGTTRYTCSCGHTYDAADITAPGHKWTDKVDAQYLVSAATCLNKAVYKKSCSVCKIAHATETFKTGDKLGHDFTVQGRTDLASAATCTDDAVYYLECSRCDATAKNNDETKKWTDAETAFGHNYAYNPENPLCSNAGAGQHWYLCQNGCQTFGAVVDGVQIQGGTESCTHTNETNCVTKPKCQYCHVDFGDYNMDVHKNTELRDEKAGNCGDDGYTGDVYCLDCEQYNETYKNTDGFVARNTIIEKGEVIPATNNHSKDAEGDKVATCKTQAYCSVCKKYYGELNPDNHLEGARTYYEEVAATCLAAGHNAYFYCADCEKDIGKEVYPQLEHSYTLNAAKDNVVEYDDEDKHAYICQNGCGQAGVGTELGAKEDCYGGDATCTELAKCSVCGKEYGELEPHVYNEEVADYDLYGRTPATCTEQATYYKSCVCGKSSKDVEGEEAFFAYGKLLPHDYSAETVDEKYFKSAATCENEAVYYKSCSACGKSSEGTADEATFKTGAKLVHDYSGAFVNNNNGTHSQLCVNGCNKPGAAVSCSDYTVAHTKVPNCSETGTDTYTCNQCGYSYEVTLNKDTSNHNYAGDMRYDGKDAGTHSFKCTYGCNTYGNATACSYETNTVAPGCTTQGYTTHTCSVCGGGYTDNYVAANGHTWSQEPISTQWSDDYTSATATYKCSVCDFKESVIGYSTSVTDDATCEGVANPVKGNTTYTVIFNFKDIRSYKLEKVVSGQFAAHNYTRLVGVKSDATCTKPRVDIYGCSFDGCSSQIERTAIGSELGHTYGAPEFTWNYTAENETLTNATATVTATRTCTACAAKPEEGNVIPVTGITVTSKITVDPTCEEVGERTYTASVYIDNEAEPRTDTLIVGVAAIGHDWGVPQFNWTTANEKATVVVTRVCGNDGEHVKTYADDDVDVKVENNTSPDCVNGGYDTYIATVDYDDTAYSSAPYKVDLAPLGHKYAAPVINFTHDAANETYDSATGAATATQTCTVCKAEDELEGRIYALPEDSIEIEYYFVNGFTPTCEKAGMREYIVTATGLGEGNQKIEYHTVDVLKRGHAYKAPVFVWKVDEEAETATVTATQTCANEGTCENREIPVTGIEISFVRTLEPKCEEKGHYTYSAYVMIDGERYDAEDKIVYIKETGHTYGELIAQVDPTCITEGTIAHYECADCGKFFVDGENDSYVEKTADELVIEKTKHPYGDIVYLWDGYDKCTAERVCQYDECGKKDTLVMTGEMITSSVTLEPLCWREGVRTYTAKGEMEYGVVAENSITEPIAMTDHVYNDEDYESNDDGTHTARCATCEGKFPVYDTKECKAAEDAEWVIDKAATCDKAGSKSIRCATCDYKIKVEEIAALGHDYTKQAIEDDYLVVAATCTEKAVYKYLCSRCDNVSNKMYEYGEVDADNHNFKQKLADKAHEATPATCTEKATYYYDCTRCNAINNAEDAETFAAGTVDKNAHDYDDTKSEANLTRPQPLNANGEVILELTDDTKIAEWTKGYYTFSCKRDASHTVTETVERADYKAYSDARNKLEFYNGVLDDLTDAAKDIVTKALAADTLTTLAKQSLIATEQAEVDVQAAALQSAVDALMVLDKAEQLFLKTSFKVIFKMADETTSEIIVAKDTAIADVKAKAPSNSDAANTGEKTHNTYSFDWASAPETITADLTINEVATAGECDGGKATCNAKAICSVCHTAYGDVDKTTHTGGSATCITLAKCEVCGEEYGEFNDKVHSYGTYKLYEEETCMANRKEIAYCEDCYDAESEDHKDCYNIVTVPGTIKDHQYEVDKEAAASKSGYHVEKCKTEGCTAKIETKCTTGRTDVVTVDATCFAAGSTTTTKFCKECENQIGEPKVEAIAQLKHSFTNYVVTSEATCQSNEIKTAVCNYCKTQENTLETEGTKLAHSYTICVAEEVDGEKTGYHIATCSTCAEDTEKATKRVRCVLGEETRVIDKVATCSAAGAYTDTAECIDKCGYTVVEKGTLDKTAHNTTLVKGTPKTCTVDGVIDYWTCDGCNKWYSDAACTKVIEDHVEGIIDYAKGHKEVIVKGYDATCTSDGKTDGKKCENCGEVIVKQVVIKHEGHKFSGAISNGNGTHSGKCTVCGAEETASKCYGGTATCQAKPVCDGCGAEYGSKSSHSFTVFVYDDNATCDKDGTETAKCDFCSQTKRQTKKDSALGHSIILVAQKNPTCTQSGWEPYEYCERCDYSTKVTLPATGEHVDADNDGKCDTCGKNVSTGSSDVDSSDCSCMCHKSGFMQLIYKIIRLFWKAFKSNKTCACGAVHY